VRSRKTAVRETSDALLVPFRVVLGQRKTAISEISGALVVHLDGLDLAEDLTAVVATLDQISWSCRAGSRRQQRIMVCHRWVTIRSAAYCIDQWKRRMAGDQNLFMCVSPVEHENVAFFAGPRSPTVAATE
jgi:hypothetical protein